MSSIHEQIILFPHQASDRDLIYKAWLTHQNVLLVYPTGGGKTVIISDIIAHEKSPCCVIAHRQELVSQISLALGKNNVYHTIIGSKSVIKSIVNLHMLEFGRSYYNPNSKCAVASVDTLILRKDALKDWCKTVKLWVIDEGHHVAGGDQKPNKWYKATQLFENARGLGVTATPIRLDKQGLGRHADGVFDTMIVGPSMRDLINMGYLTPYAIYSPITDLSFEDINTDKSGELNPKQLQLAIDRSHVVGDIVDSYLKLTPGLKGITFTSSIKTAHDLADEYNSKGVPALALSGKSKDLERAQAKRKLDNGDLLQLVNVDLFGEGFDLPAIEVVSMGGHTNSFGKYCQQFGRVVRTKKGKKVGNVIDHVGNVHRHKVPDRPIEWTLDRGLTRTLNKTDEYSLKTCGTCFRDYERIYKICPYCGVIDIPTSRKEPKHVDGDLTEIDPETLALMRCHVNEIDKDKEIYRQELIAKYIPVKLQHINVARHVKNQETQAALRASISWWSAYQTQLGYDNSESYRLFYLMFGIDIVSAQALRHKKATELTHKVNNNIEMLHVSRI